MPDEASRSVLRVAVLIEEPGLRADILERLGGRVGLRLVDDPDEADVLLGDGQGGPGQQHRRQPGTEGSEPAIVTILPGRGLRAAPGSSLVSADASGDLLEAVLRVASEGYEVRPGAIEAEWAGEEAGDPMADPGDLDRRTLPPLTPREREVLALLAEGAPNKVIARRLQISPSTAKFHVASLLDKLGAQSRLDAVAIGARLGLVLL